MTQSRNTVTKLGAHTVLTLQGSITWQNGAELETRLQEVMGKNQSAVILDCKEVGYLDSTALEMFLRIQDIFQGRGCRMKLVGLNAVCQDILIATRLISQFHVYPDMQEAVKETP